MSKSRGKIGKPGSDRPSSTRLQRPIPAMQALVLDPGNAGSLHRAGLAAYREQNWSRAIALMRRCLPFSGENPDFFNNLAGAYISAGQYRSGAAFLLQALVLAPDSAKAINNLGLLFSRSGQKEAATAWLNRCIALRPEFHQALINLATVQEASGQVNEARDSYSRALALQPQSAELWINRGKLMFAIKDLRGAENCFRVAMVLADDPVSALNNYGVMLQEQGRVAEALPYLARAARANPNFPYGGMNLLFSELYVESSGLAKRLQDARNWMAGWARLDPLHPPRQSTAQRGEQPRIGIVSPDFRRHAVGFLAIPAVEALARRGFVIHCYSNRSMADPIATRFKAVGPWRDIAGLSDQQAADLIVRDEIDILIDLGGFSADNRLTLFAAKPAPVQIAWLGYPGSTGLDAIDYILADDRQIPEGTDGFYSEKVIRLPHSYAVYQPVDAMPLPGPLPAMANGYVTFGVFNALKKVTPAMLALWAEILTQIPNSRLLFKTPVLDDAWVRDRLAGVFQGFGIPPDRLSFLGNSSPQDHQLAMARIDLALDSFPYTGGLTTLETLWMGVPVISCKGDSFASRHSFGYLSTLGLADWVADDLEAYKAKALAMAADLPRLAALRQSLRGRMQASKLCDIDGFAADLDRALTSVWRRWQDGEPASRLTIPAAFDDGWSDAGWRHLQKGHPDAARRCYQNALAQQPACADLLNNMGLALSHLGQPGGAMPWFARSANADPGSPAAWTNLGQALYSLGRNDAAAAMLGQALKINPSYAEAWINLGALQSAVQRYVTAERSCRIALILIPDSMPAWNNLGAALQEQGRAAEGVVALAHAVAVERRRGYALMNFLFSRLYVTGNALASQLSEATAGMTAGPAVSLPPPVPSRSFAQGRPRIGLVSADFRQHAVGFLAIPALEALARAGYRLTCYSHGPVDDPVTARFRALGAWRQIAGIPDERAAAMIRADAIDILIDLGGFSANNRLLLFADRPAPVQLSWLGYPGTTGLPAIDYILADAYQIDEAHDDFYSEKIIRLPHHYTAFQPAWTLPEPGPLPATVNGFVTFGMFNALKKVTATLVDVWARILRRLPDSRLLMKSPGFSDPQIADQYRRKFAELGITSERLSLIGATPSIEHQRMMASADIALDSFPYNGGLTTLESLWMGVPVISCRSDSMASRHSFGYLSGLGLADLVAEDLEDYAARAIALATDLPRLANLRAGLRARMSASPLCDVETFAGDLARMLQELWRRHCDGEAPTALTLAPTPAPTPQQIERLAVIASERRDWASARDYGRRALALGPASAVGWAMLSLANQAQTAWVAAGQACRRVLMLRPSDSEAWYNLGWLQQHSDDHAAAERAYRVTLVLLPDNPLALNNLGTLLQDLADINAALILYHRAQMAAPQQRAAAENFLFAQLYSSTLHPLDCLASAQAWSKSLATAASPAFPVATGGRPRLGLVSGDFCNHAVGNLVVPAVEALAARGYEIVCYDNGSAPDMVTARFQSAARICRPIADISDAAARALIAEDGIDLLVDLSGHSAGGRCRLFAERAAPVQLAWAGYPATTGLASMDYLLADIWQIPQGAECYYVEKIIRMPRSYIAFEPPSDAPDIAPLPALENGWVTFGSFNMSKKLSRPLRALWSKLLSQLPGSRLLLKTTAFSDPFVVDHFRRQFLSDGVDPERIQFVGRTSAAEHMRWMGHCDIALDSFPYSGGMTTLEALWMGVPVITCPGEIMAGRHSAGYLQNLGLSHLVAERPADYLDLAVTMAADLPALAAYRNGLRDRLRSSALCDVAGFAAAMDQSLRAIWSRAGTGGAPAHLYVGRDGTLSFDENGAS